MSIPKTLPKEEYVVLVDDQNHVLGTAPKATVHGPITPLHRAFSAFIFNSRGELLVQRRALSKKTWPGVWSNSCCGHPTLEETAVSAAKRRLNEELGLSIEGLEEVTPYRYCFTRFGVMENEICPIIVGFSDQKPVLNPEEVESVDYIPWLDFIKKVDLEGDIWSEWCQEETHILAENKRFQELYTKYAGLGEY